MSPALSVVMSVFNGQAYLAEAVDSILSQTFHDFEFIIINDGSTDRTAAILADYIRRDARIRVISHENKGRATSLNIGIQEAQSDYIARMDADDVALPHRFQEQFEFLESHPEVGVLGGATALIDSKGRVVGTIRSPLEDSEIRAAMASYNPMRHPTVVMRKKIATSVGGYRRQFLDADDYDLFLRMGELCRIANLDGILVRYRVHREQVSLRNAEHQFICVVAASAAAKLRAAGKADPFSGLKEIDLDLLLAIGVKQDEIRAGIFQAYYSWLGFFKEIEPDLALQAAEKCLRLSRLTSANEHQVLDAYVTAAGIHRRNGRNVKALLFAVEALLLRPSLAPHMIRGALSRFRK